MRNFVDANTRSDEPPSIHIPGIRVAPSPVHGHGCWATRAFDPDELIGWYEGNLVPFDDSVPNAIQIGPGLYINPPAHGRIHPLWFVNHRAEPNVRLEVDGHRAAAICFRPLAPGDELFIDYRAMMFEESWRMVCGDGQLVASLDVLDEDTRAMLLARGDVPRWIEESLARRVVRTA